METKQTSRVSVTPYVTGFVFAVVLTLLAYAIVVNRWLSGGMLVAAIMTLAVVQLVVQLVFFLHLGRGKSARWNVTAFLFMVLILVIVVAGSLWIMHNLDYNMQMTPQEMDGYMKQQSNAGF
jgi:cytochrome o ubiquinol oxidase operon protein cyoD